LSNDSSNVRKKPQSWKIFKLRGPRVFRSAVFEENSCRTRVDVRAGSDRQTEARESAADGMGA
jgi:hypothetical protein